VAVEARQLEPHLVEEVVEEQEEFFFQRHNH
jgi:hypothetical protein